MANKKDSPNLIFRKEWWDFLRWETPEVIGTVIKILCDDYFGYAHFDVEKFNNDNPPMSFERLAIPMIQAASGAKLEYLQKCDRLTNNIKSRWNTNGSKNENQNTNEYNCIQTNTNEYNCTHNNIIEGNIKDNIYLSPKSIKNSIKENTFSEKVLSAEADPQPSTQPILNYKTIIDGWNSIECLPKIASLTEQRKQKIKIRNSEIEKSGITWQMLFDKIRGTPFLLGQNKNNWSATFDWLISNSQNWLKIIEGNYDGQQRQQTVDDNAIAAAVRIGYNSAIEDG